MDGTFGRCHMSACGPADVQQLATADAENLTHIHHLQLGVTINTVCTNGSQSNIALSAVSTYAPSATPAHPMFHVHCC